MTYLKNILKTHKLSRAALSVLVAVSILCSAFTMLATIPASADNNIWNGQVAATAPTDSDGDGWIEINNGADLAYIIKNGGGAGNKYKLTADIYLNDPTKIDWDTGVVADGYTANAWFDEWGTNKANDFQGTIDGDGYVIYGLYLEENKTPSYTAYHQGTGLIPRIAEGGSVTITNLGIDSAYLHHANAAGAFVGAMHKDASLTMENCYAGIDVTIKGQSAGVLFGYARNNQPTTFSATNCYSLATTVAASGGTYGLVGYKNSGTKGSIISCYNGNGPMTVATNPGYFFTATNSYESLDTINLGSNATYNKIAGVTTVTEANMQGPDALTNADKMPNLGNAYEATDLYPELSVFNKTTEPEKVIVVWDGQVAATAPTDTNSDGWIEINNGADLAYIIKNGGGAGNKYKLTADIYLNDPTKIDWDTGVVADGYTVNAWFDEWGTNKANDFQGTIDGDGYVIYGLYLEENKTPSYTAYHQGTGLIPRIAEGGSVTITNLGIDSAYLHHANAAGAFVGAMHKDASLTMENCYAGIDVTIKGQSAGVLFGYARNNQPTTFSATNCYSLATTVAASGGTYGLVGYKNSGTKGSIISCYNGNGPMTVATNPGYFFTATNSYESLDTINLGSNATYDKIAGVTTLDAAIMVGPDALTNDAKMANLGDAYEANDSYPTLKVFNKQDAGDQPGGTEPEGPTMPTPDQVWNGLRNTAPVDSNNDGWLEITNGEELAYAIYNGGGANNKYILTKDIFLNDPAKIDWKTGAKLDNEYVVNSWFDHGRTFQGEINGNGYVIYGLYSNVAPSVSGPYGSALIPVITSGGTATIKNLGVDYSYISHHNASAFVAAAQNATIVMDNCYAGKDVTLIGKNAGAFRGYAKNALGGSITNCYSLATTTGSDQSGLIGLFWDATDSLVITNCYNSNGPLSTHGGMGQANSSNNYISVAGAFTEGVTVVAEANMKGESALTNMPLGDAYKVTDSYPTLKVFDNPGASGNEPGGNEPGGNEPGGNEPGGNVPDGPANPDAPIDYVVWNGLHNTAPVDTNGDGWYEITSGEELAYVIKNGGGLNNKYKLTTDIYLNNLNKINWQTGKAAEGYTINKWFDNSTATDFVTGIIDGNGYVIYGLYYDDESTSYTAGPNAVGLIPRLTANNDLTIKNLGIDNVYFNHVNTASAFLGTAMEGNTLDFSNCYAGENVTIKAANAAVFRGYAYKLITSTTITNCYSLATLTGSVGSGFVATQYDYVSGQKRVTFVNCYNANGPLNAANNFGIVAQATNSYATAIGGTGTQLTAGITVKTQADMKGANALVNMPLGDAYVATDSYPVLVVFTDAVVDTTGGEKPGDIWTGAIAKDFANGGGIENDPFLIGTASELALAISSNGKGKYYKLTADIYLNDVSNKLWYLEEDVREWVQTNGFSGHIDGNGYIVYGVYFDKESNHEKAGLVSTFTSGSIKNLGVRNSVINAKNYAGGIVGWTINGVKVIDSCFADETVYVNTTQANSGVAGIVGMAFDNTNATEISLTITNCYSKAKLTGSNAPRLNGIVGASFRSPYSIKNCYSVGFPVYTATMGGGTSSAVWNYVAGATPEETVDEMRAGVKVSDYFSNLYCDVGTPSDATLITVIAKPETMRGAAAKTAMPGLNFNNVFQTVDGGTPKLKIFTSITGKDVDTSADGDFFGKGSGTKNDPYIISTVEHLRYVVESVDTKGKYYKLANDIYVNDTTDPDWMKKNPEEWYSHAGTVKFAGHFDGAGFKIHGLYVNEDIMAYDGKTNSVSHGAGLFPMVLPEATIRNTHIRDSYLKGYGSVGALVGYVRDGGIDSRLSIVACSVDESVTLEGFAVGGLVGVSHARALSFIYCYSNTNVSNKGPADQANSFVGNIWSAQVSVYESYSLGHKVLPGNGGMLVNTKKLYSDVDQLNVILIDKASITGNKAKDTLDFDWKKVWVAANGKTPQLKYIAYDTEYVPFDEGVKGRVWSGKVATAYAGGDGTQNNPYLIETPEQLALIFTLQSGEFTYYKLMADIKLNDTSKANWEETANQWFAGTYIFRGEFDGNGHIVSGLYYNKTDNTADKFVNAGLFQRLGYDSTVKKLGVIDSKIINTSKTGWVTYAAAIVSYIEHWRPDLFPERTPPVISECFADDSVYLAATTAGGIVAAAQTTVIIENCYFTGELNATNMGSIVGNAWNGTEGPIIKNSYSATLDFNAAGTGAGFNFDAMNNGASYFENLYIAGPVSTEGITPISLMFMKGDYATEYLVGFDFDKIWKVTESGTPVLRCFKNPEKYTCTRDPDKIQISFGNLGDAIVEPIYGFAGYTEITEDTLPIPQRVGYIFNGWRHHNPQGVACELTRFPNYDITLYANWTEVGFANNFDAEISEEYDINAGIEIFKPGMANYNIEYVHSGWRSLHTLADSAVAPRFLLFYDKALEAGREYQVTFWMTTDMAEATGKVYLEHGNYADVNANILGYEEAATYNLKQGEWKQFTVTTVANGACLFFRTDIGASVFFEDITVVPTGATGEIGNLLAYTPDSVSGEPGSDNANGGLAPWLIAVIACGAVLILGGVAVGVIFAVRRKKTA